MGAYTPVDFVSEEDMKVIEHKIIKPTLTGLEAEGKLLSFLFFLPSLSQSTCIQDLP